MNYNRVILAGNLTRDPEITYTQTQTAICKFGMAVNRKWKPKEGPERNEVCWVDCVAFGKGGETIKQYMSKGSSVLIEGRLKFDSWDGPDGSKRSKLSVIVDQFQFVGNRPQAEQPKKQTEQAPAAFMDYDADKPDGIPF